MGEHIDNRNLRKKDKEADVLERKRRVTFKNYIRELEEEELMNQDPDEDLDEAE